VTAALPVAGRNLRVQAAAVAAAFMLNGIAFGTWAARIPAVKAQTGLDATGLGFALLGASVGAVLTMTFGGWLGSRFGTHVMTPLTTVGCAVMMVFIGASWSFASLTISLRSSDFAGNDGRLDERERHRRRARRSRPDHVAAARLLEHRRLMPARSSARRSPPWEFRCCRVRGCRRGPGRRRRDPALYMLPDRHAEGGAGIEAPHRTAGASRGLALCGLMAEGSASDWSGVYLQSTMNASQGVAGLAVTVFAGCMPLPDSPATGSRWRSAPPGW